MNATKVPSKRSRIERGVDYIILFMFSLLFCMCLIGSIYFAVWTVEQSPDHWYIETSDTPTQYDPSNGGLVGFFSFITSFILYGETLLAALAELVNLLHVSYQR